MGDKGKILFGLSVFVILVTFPFWSRLAAAGDPQPGRPELEYPGRRHGLRGRHAVHDGQPHESPEPVAGRPGPDGESEYISSTGETYTKSLTKTCLNCHENRDDFCTRCHDYADVQPTCWECHTTPGGGA